MPWTPEDASHHALETNGDPGDSFHWYSCPDVVESTEHTLVMDIPVEEFERSMDRNLVRYGTLLNHSQSFLVDPGDPYVQKIAEHILGEAGDPSDSDKATLALNFVQTAIRYVSDETNYGCDEFWASPAETLYLHGGDCEDKAVLLCSIFGAMGLEWVLLDYPSHVAAGVYAGDTDGYLFCESTFTSPTKLGEVPSSLKGETPEPHVEGDSEGIVFAATKGFAWLRYLMEDVTGI